MDFSWSEEQLAYRDKVIAFARAHLDPDDVGLESLWQKDSARFCGTPKLPGV